MLPVSSRVELQSADGYLPMRPADPQFFARRSAVECMQGAIETAVGQPFESLGRSLSTGEGELDMRGVRNLGDLSARVFASPLLPRDCVARQIRLQAVPLRDYPGATSTSDPSYVEVVMENFLTAISVKGVAIAVTDALIEDTDAAGADEALACPMPHCTVINPYNRSVIVGACPYPRLSLRLRLCGDRPPTRLTHRGW